MHLCLGKEEEGSSSIRSRFCIMLGVLIVFFVTSCGAGSTDSTDLNINLDAVNILPEAFEGCRGPEDVGCESCCSGEGSVLSASCTGDGCAATWYNVYTSSYCGDRPSCASCSYRDEEGLFDLVIPETCGDCSTISIVGDVCYNPMSCECLCSRKQSLAVSCPTQ